MYYSHRSQSFTVQASTMGVAITCSATPHEKGGWTQLIAALPTDACGFYLYGHGSTYATRFMMDIGVDTATTYISIVDNIYAALVTNMNDADMPYWGAYFPIRIAAGNNIAARAQSPDGAVDFDIGIVVYEGDGGYQRCETVGADTADTTGVVIDPGAVANTKNATYTELLAAATSEVDYKGFIMATNNGTQAVEQRRMLIDIGRGAASSEVNVAQNIFFCNDYVITEPRPQLHPFLPCFIPAGSRIAGTAQGTSTTAATRGVDTVLYCFS